MQRINTARNLSCAVAVLCLAISFSSCDQNKSESGSKAVSQQAQANQKSSISESEQSGSTPDATFTPDSSLLEQVQLTVGNKETLKSLLEQHRGKVVLVDFWATWCGPCVQQFPHTVSLSEKHRDEGLAVISVSMNEPGEKDKVLAFLKGKKARLDNLLTEYGAGAEFVEAFDLRGDVPFYKLYDRKGDLRYSFSGDPEGLENCESIEKIDERVVQLLSESNEPSTN